MINKKSTLKKSLLQKSLIQIKDESDLSEKRYSKENPLSETQGEKNLVKRKESKNYNRNNDLTERESNNESQNEEIKENEDKIKFTFLDESLKKILSNTIPFNINIETDLTLKKLHFSSKKKFSKNNIIENIPHASLDLSSPFKNQSLKECSKKINKISDKSSTLNANNHMPSLVSEINQVSHKHNSFSSSKIKQENSKHDYSFKSITDENNHNPSKKASDGFQQFRNQTMLERYKNTSLIYNPRKESQRSLYANSVNQKKIGSKKFLRAETPSNIQSNCSTQNYRQKNLNSNFRLCTPSINQKAKEKFRDKLIFDELYEEKRNKQIKEEILLKDKDNKIKKEINRSYVLPSSMQYLIKKFNIEFNEAFKHSSNQYDKLNYVDLINLLSMLGFLNLKNLKKDPQEKIQLFEIWKILKGEELLGISIRNINVFLLCVMGYYSTWMNISSQYLNAREPYIILEEKESFEKSTEMIEEEFGHFCELNNDFIVNKEEARNIHRSFKLFYENKIDLEQIMNQISTKNSLNNFNIRLIDRKSVV